MTRSTGRNLNLVKAYNISAILLRLLQSELVSRVELAKVLSLSSTTITNLISELLDDGIIAEVEVKPSSEPRVGRPRRMLKLIPSTRYAIGVHIGIGMFRVAVTNLMADIVISQTAQFDLDTSPKIVLKKIAEEIDHVIQASDIDRNRILGIGVGASGLVDRENGINILSPRLCWENIQIRSILGNFLSYPICVDNNVRSMALGEAMFGSGRDVNMLAFVYGRVGVGAGFVVDGKVYQGNGQGAGEIGHTVLLMDSGEICSCGNVGCLETLVSERVLLKEAESITNRFPTGLLAQYLAQKDKTKSIERVFNAARDGDEITRKMIDERSCYLGIALANLVNIMNPELILLGGMFAEGHDLIIPVVEAKIREISFAGMGENVKIAPTQFGWRAGVIGAASLALSSFFYEPPKGF